MGDRGALVRDCSEQGREGGWDGPTWERVSRMVEYGSELSRRLEAWHSYLMKLLGPSGKHWLIKEFVMLLISQFLSYTVEINQPSK